MKIAVPTKDSKVDDHFGHCAYYTIYTINEDEVASKQTLESPQGCGCKSNIATTLHEMGVTLMLAGNMGDGAMNKLASSDIDVIRGCAGFTDKVVEAYLSGMLLDSGIACSSHDDHECSHNH